MKQKTKVLFSNIFIKLKTRLSLKVMDLVVFENCQFLSYRKLPQQKVGHNFTRSQFVPSIFPSYEEMRRHVRSVPFSTNLMFRVSIGLGPGQADQNFKFACFWYVDWRFWYIPVDINKTRVINIYKNLTKPPPNPPATCKVTFVWNSATSGVEVAG